MKHRKNELKNEYNIMQNNTYSIKCEHFLLHGKSVQKVLFFIYLLLFSWQVLYNIQFKLYKSHCDVNPNLQESNTEMQPSYSNNTLHNISNYTFTA